MAAITGTNLRGTNGATTIARTVLGASDTLTYVGGGILVLYNTTAAPVNVTIDGAGATTVSPAGFGGTVDISAGKVVVVGADATVAINLDAIAAYLSGVITLTGGTGVTAHVLN